MQFEHPLPMHGVVAWRRRADAFGQLSKDIYIVIREVRIDDADGTNLAC